MSDSTTSPSQVDHSSDELPTKLHPDLVRCNAIVPPFPLTSPPTLDYKNNLKIESNISNGRS